MGGPIRVLILCGASAWKSYCHGSWLSRALPLFLLAASCNIFGLDRDLTIAQFYHTAWTIAEGAPIGLQKLAQTADGYLWLGTSSGLIRFDGVRFQRYDPAQGDRFPSHDISVLLATPDGGLWVAFRPAGLTFMKNGRARSYGERDGLPFASAVELALDREGAVWAATSHGLFRFENSRWNKIGSEWGFSAEFVAGLFVDNQGKLWVNGSTDLYCLPRGAHVFQTRKFPNDWDIFQTADGSLWLDEYGKGIRAVYGPLGQFYDRSKPALELPVAFNRILVDRDGSTWMVGDGVLRIANLEKLTGRSIASTSSLIQRFNHKDGLTDDRVEAVLEDREGSIWVATDGGLDRFRRKNIVQGGPSLPLMTSIPALIADRRGVVWEGAERSLMTVDNDGVSVREGVRISIPFDVRNRMPYLGCAWPDSEGAFWLGGANELARFANGRFEKIAFPADVPLGSWAVQAITRDRAGDLWVSIQQHGVYRRHEGVWTHFGNLQALPKTTAVVLWTDSGGRVWFGYMGNQIALVDGDQVRIFSSSDGLHIGNVLAIGGRGAHIWAAGQFGLALFDGNRFRTVAGEADADFRGISGVVETSNGDFWLNEASGVVHIPAAEIANRLQDAHHRLGYDLFDFRDGVTGAATQIRPLPSAVLATDGRIWMSGSSGIYWVDPARIYKNPLPPPVTIETIYADDKRYDPHEMPGLPVLPANVRIEYTALSLSIPERVRFRYQLEGYDKNWQDGGTRRAASYTKLPPGHFRFHVIACNNDGVWNQTGAVAAIVVPPTFFQTIWFEVLCACAALGLLWSIYILRLRQISTQMHGRLEERLAERTRIARELHDTLLQSFQGLMLRFQVAHDELPARPAEARETLENALDEAAQAIAEGRDAVQGLRSSTVETNDLARAIGSLGAELAVNEANSHRVKSFVDVEGAPRNLHPIRRDEIYRIAGEALRNAFRHAQASRIEVTIWYGERQFRLRVRDDGKGIDPKVLDERGRVGHWGLPGMRERAELIGGQLEIWSQLGSGTQVELSIPASIAYGTAPARRFRWFARNTETNS
jgi:signal transduction histidine kinase/ligand-binding sensor domain-containing protein